MNFKIVIQLLLSTLIIFLISLFYLNFFYKKNKSSELINKKNKTFNFENVQNNLVKDISYKKIYSSTGDKFLIEADFGKFIDDNNEIIEITNVNASITRDDGTVVYITSDNAKYDTINNNTNFMNDVELTYLEHIINSNYMDLIFSKNLIQAYGDLKYQNLEYKLFADKMELDLISKNTKIFMLDNSKVKIKKK